ncbi:MAG: hypothetical protein N2115_04890 [bacterium]|nr:hypothetical protein [bacterium]
MGKNTATFVLILILVFSVISGCGRKRTTEEVQQTGQVLKNFSMEFFGDSFSFTLTGLAAEKKTSESQASVSRPGIEIKGKNFVIEIKTGAKGIAEIFLVPETQNISRIVMQNNINIVQRNLETGQINFSASCEKLTYLEKEDTIIMEGSPKVQQGENFYSADRIIYSFKENRLKFEGNVQVSFKKGMVNN